MISTFRPKLRIERYIDRHNRFTGFLWMGLMRDGKWRSFGALRGFGDGGPGTGRVVFSHKEALRKYLRKLGAK